MKTFSQKGKINTDETCRIALERAAASGCAVVAASTGGDSGCRLCEIADELSFSGPIVIVTHAYGSIEPGKTALKDECREAMLSRGVRLVTAAHALSGAERGISRKFQGVYPVEIIAHTLRMFSAGVKVCVEISSMALDAGALDFGTPVIALGGTGRGLDTAVVITPSHANTIFDTNIHEILCMPY